MSRVWDERIFALCSMNVCVLSYKWEWEVNGVSMSCVKTFTSGLEYLVHIFNNRHTHYTRASCEQYSSLSSGLWRIGETCPFPSISFPYMEPYRNNEWIDTQREILLVEKEKERKKINALCVLWFSIPHNKFSVCTSSVKFTTQSESLCVCRYAGHYGDAFMLLPATILFKRYSFCLYILS